MFILCYACAASTITVLNPIVVKEVFGMMEYNAILPWVGIPAGVSSSVCVTIWSILREATGNYTLCAVLSAVAVLLMMLAVIMAYHFSKAEKFQGMIQEKQ